MPYETDETHDPNLESWVESANDPETDFPIQNLPIAAYVRGEPLDGDFRHGLCTRIGDLVIDLGSLGSLLNADPMFDERDGLEWDAAWFLGSHPDRRRYLRKRLVQIFKKDNPELRDDEALKAIALLPADTVQFDIAHQVHDYTDFYASVHHATNVGSMFRPDNPLLPNYKWIPVGYHGRASSVVPHSADIRRPSGQQAPKDEGGTPTFGPCKMLDYELELGAVIGRANELGEPVSIDDAESHILGVCLLNDWSARDLQKWEYQPLGPFLAKSFATSVSPYIVTMEALAPFRAPRFERAPDDPKPLAHLDSDHDRAHGAIDITVEAYLRTKQMRDKDIPPHRLSKGSFKDMYWTIAQMVAHHTSNGCNLQPGDLLGSGTISGPSRDSRGCLLELTWDGDPWANPPVKAPTTQRTPIGLPTGETRTFLEDGDEVILKGYCERKGFRRIGFGECSGVIAPAR